MRKLYLLASEVCGYFERKNQHLRQAYHEKGVALLGNENKRKDFRRYNKLWWRYFRRETWWGLRKVELITKFAKLHL